MIPRKSTFKHLYICCKKSFVFYNGDIDFNFACQLTSSYSNIRKMSKFVVTNNDLKSIFSRAVESVLPNNVIKNNLKVDGKTLIVKNKSYLLNKNCYVVGFGKAVLGMAVEVEKILGEHVASGILSVPVGILNTFKNVPGMTLSQNSNLVVIEGARNNLPDNEALTASRRIEDLVKDLGENALLIVLISGGGSALLPAPVPPVTLEEKCNVIQMLASSGANIVELNCVRKKLSVLKGGGLARLANPAQIIAFILSDVVGDDISSIASGPTVDNNDSPSDALNVLVKYDLLERIPASVKAVLDNRQTRNTGGWPNVQNLIIGNNSLALESAAAEAEAKGYHPVVLSKRVFNSVHDVCVDYTTLVTNILKVLSSQMTQRKFLNAFDVTSFKIELESNLKEMILQGILSVGDKKGLCLLAGGETTVTVRGKGKGGRNQELALAFSMSMHQMAKENPNMKNFNIILLSAGTDGIDGPTEAAGAIGYREQIEEAIKLKLDFEQYLSNNDSHNFFFHLGKEDDLIVTGHTGTNVMDIHAIVIQPFKDNH